MALMDTYHSFPIKYCNLNIADTLLNVTIYIKNPHSGLLLKCAIIRLNLSELFIIQSD